MYFNTFSEIRKKFSIPGMIIGIFLVFGYLATFYFLKDKFLLFHTMVESVVTLVGFSIFIIAVNTYRFAKNGFFLFVGLSFFFYSILNFFHTVSYSGLNLISRGANIPTQLWISERFLLAIIFLIAPFFLKRKFKYSCYLGSITFLILSTASILSSILYFMNFPVAYIDGAGLTSFKIVSEYIISLMFIIGIIVFHLNRRHMDLIANFYIISSLLFSLMAELVFTLYVDVYGTLSMVGHLFVFISIMFIYGAFLRKTLSDPYFSLFQELSFANKKLKELATTDDLTGLLNRRAALEKIIEEFKKKKRYGGSFSIIMFDLDFFKEINDTFGHVYGDRVLQEFATSLTSGVREQDIVGRFGGDEFIVCPLEADSSNCLEIVNKIKHQVEERRISVEKTDNKIKIKFTAGYYSCKPLELNDRIGSDGIINLADTILIENKKSKKLALKENTKIK